MRSAETFNPSEDAIARVLEKAGGNPRNLAIAYLRSQHRQKRAEAKSKTAEAVRKWSDAAQEFLKR